MRAVLRFGGPFWGAVLALVLVLVALFGGVRCYLDAWSEYTAATGPERRQDQSMIWDADTSSALMFGGQASNTFQYFNDLWQFHWPSRSWAEMQTDFGPSPRFGHSAVWDVVSRTMLILGGTHMRETYGDMWAYESTRNRWTLWLSSKGPGPRVYHTAVWDPLHRAMLVFGGESGVDILAELHYFSFVNRAWWPLTIGLGPRSKHTAVWDAATRSMLVFGGLDGQSYLSNLQRYDANSDSWTEVAAAGTVPWPRGGHAAAWDPASASMLVFGGVQNRSNTLSFSDGFFSFSVLTGIWTELGPGVPGASADLPQGPSARASPSLVFDAASPALLLFGGFNGSYLGETWRYVMTPTAPTPTLRCQLGQPCPAGTEAGNLSMDIFWIKTSCQSSHGLPPLDGTRLFMEPDSYQLCSCVGSPSCIQAQDHTTPVGRFIAEGPYANQSANCYIGWKCTVPVWMGVGISINDSLIARDDCEHMLASTYTLVVTIYKSANALLLDAGMIDSAGTPQVVELCWCPFNHSCDSAEDGPVCFWLKLLLVFIPSVAAAIVIVL